MSGDPDNVLEGNKVEVQEYGLLSLELNMATAAVFINTHESHVASVKSCLYVDVFLEKARKG